jgi:glycosyltransferase involved in cell wall biosynthesis
MKIAQVAPLYESVPPKLYGGTERVVSYLTEELVQLGHDVTLFASGDSETSAHLVPVSPVSLRLDKNSIDSLAHHILMLEKVFQAADEFDLIHYHCDYLHFPFSRRYKTPHLTTLHGRLDIHDLVPLYREFAEIPVVSISNHQREPLPWLNWRGTVYHGLPLALHQLHPQPGKYLAFLGRVSPEKGVDSAIEIAQKSGIELRIAAKVDQADQHYFDTVIEPLLTTPLVQFVGEITDRDKGDFLGQAIALLAPVNWPEPFGLAMIEAMACGTPVIAFRRGSIPEVVDESKSGFIVDNVEEAVAAIKNIHQLDRRLCRQTFEQRFSALRMARDYLGIYEKLVENKTDVKAMARSRAASQES